MRISSRNLLTLLLVAAASFTYSCGGGDPSSGGGGDPPPPIVVTLTNPQSNHFQWNHSLSTQATAVDLPIGYGIKFILDSGAPNQRDIFDMSEPFSTTFAFVDGGAHSVTAIAVDNLGIEVSGSSAWDQVSNVVLGDYYVGMGDSITAGSGDDDFNDGVGYEPILESSLSSLLGYSHTVVNEGVSGTLASDGASIVFTHLNNHPNASYFLILYGSNDAKLTTPIPSGQGLNPGDFGYSGSYKASMEDIVTAVLNNGRTPYLALVPYNDRGCTSCNNMIQEYNVAIGELVGKYSIQVTPPDFFTYYKNNTNELADGLHPNGVGYQSMASLWETALTQ